MFLLKVNMHFSLGSSTCSACAPGKHQKMTGQSSCDDCEIGKNSFSSHYSIVHMTHNALMYSCMQLIYGQGD